MIARTMNLPLALLALLGAGVVVRAADEPNPYDVARDNAAAATAQWKTQLAGRDDVLITESVLADRTAKTVTVLSYATGIGQDEAVEFFLTAASSGKDYEALAITHARPSDVVAALKFIGCTPGQPVDMQQNRYWPRGQRVIMTYDVGGKSISAEDCVINVDTKQTLPHDGFVFAASYTYTDADGHTHLAADEAESKSIAADYNDPAGVLDVPRRLPQGVAYGFQKPAPAIKWKQGQPVPVILRPAPAEAAVAERYLTIAIRPAGDRIAYTIQTADRDKIDAADLPHVVTAVATLVDGKTDWFTTVTVDPAVRIEELRKLYAVLQAVEKDRSIKLDPPPKGELFYRSLFPDPQWRVRENRLGEPWELFLARRDGKLVPRLERMVEPENAEPDARRVLQSFPVATPASFAKQIEAGASQWSKAIFVYPPPDLRYGELMEFARPVMGIIPQLFVFPSAVASTQPATAP